MSFSQQEQPKRVTVVVSAREITPQKEIVQIPADNTPTNVDKARRKTTTGSPESSTKITAPKKSNPTKEKITTQAPIIAKAPTTNIKPKVAASTPLESKVKLEEKVAKSKVITPKENKTAEKTPQQTTVPKVPKANLKNTEISTSKPEEKVEDELATVKTENNTQEVTELAQQSKANSFSYIWIGAFLIIAGVVLGLLFGKPAFLISFVGIVFIVLGMLI